MEAPTDEPALLPDRPRVDARRPLALIVGVVAAVLFVALRLAVDLDGGAPLAFDVWWDDAMAALANPVLVIIAWIPATVGGTIGMIVIGVSTTIVFLLVKRPWDALNVASAIALVVLIGAPLAAVIARARPSDSLAETQATSSRPGTPPWRRPSR